MVCSVVRYKCACLCIYFHIFISPLHTHTQETPDAIPEGETPHTISVYAYDYLVDHVKPGDRVEITGIYKARPVRVSRNRRTMRAVYPTFLDAIHFRKLNNQTKKKSADG